MRNAVLRFKGGTFNNLLFKKKNRTFINETAKVTECDD
jgi:hypothetical protein